MTPKFLSRLEIQFSIFFSHFSPYGSSCHRKVDFDVRGHRGKTEMLNCGSSGKPGKETQLPPLSENRRDEEQNSRLVEESRYERVRKSKKRREVFESYAALSSV